MYALNYGGKDVQLTSEQITAALFTKLKEIGENALGTKVSFHHVAILIHHLGNDQVNDVVISCPSYFTDAERRALLDSAKMSGLNVLRSGIKQLVDGHLIMISLPG